MPDDAYSLDTGVPAGETAVPLATGDTKNDLPADNQARSPHYVTLPGAPESTEQGTPQAGSPAEPTIEVEGIGQVPVSEVKKWRDGHLMQGDYTRNMQELADQRRDLQEVAQFRDYLRENPQVVQAALAAMQQQVPAEGMGAQPPPIPPALYEQIEYQQSEIGNIKFQMDLADFERKYPHADSQAVAKFAYENTIPSLENAYKVMDYENAGKAALQQASQRIDANRAAGVETGAEGPPAQRRVDISSMSERDILKLGVDHYGIYKE